MKLFGQTSSTFCSTPSLTFLTSGPVDDNYICSGIQLVDIFVTDTNDTV
jgi:hypothetical protein